MREAAPFVVFTHTNERAPKWPRPTSTGTGEQKLGHDPSSGS
jgi:hypothetical protein